MKEADRQEDGSMFTLIMIDRVVYNPATGAAMNETDRNEGTFETRQEAQTHAEHCGGRYRIRCTAHGLALCGQCDNIRI